MKVARINKAKNEKVISVDPGGTTGWCLARFPGFVTVAGETGSVTDIIGILDSHKPDTVVVEAFRIYPWRAKNLSWSNVPAVEVLGAVKVWCNSNNAAYIEQSAASRKLISKLWLQTSGLWKATRGKPHARDAARHLLYYCITNALIMPKDLDSNYTRVTDSEVIAETPSPCLLCKRMSKTP